MADGEKIVVPGLDASGFINGLREVEAAYTNIIKNLNNQRFNKGSFNIWADQEKAIASFKKQVESIGDSLRRGWQVTGREANKFTQTLASLTASTGLSPEEVAKKFVPSVDNFGDIMNSVRGAATSFDALYKESVDMTNSLITMDKQAKLLGIDIRDIFSSITPNDADEQIRRLTNDLAEANAEVVRLRETVDELESGERVSGLQDELETFKSTAEASARQLRQTLRSIGVDDWDIDYGEFSKYFDYIKEGSMTAAEALGRITNFDFSKLGLDSSKIDEILAKVTEIYERIGGARERLDEAVYDTKRGIAESAAGDTQAIERESQAIDRVVQSATSMKSAQDVVANFMQSVASNGPDANNAIESITRNLTNLVTSIDSLSGNSESKIESVTSVFRMLRDITSGGGAGRMPSSKSIMALASFLHSLEGIEDPGKLLALNQLDLSKFSNIKGVSESSLRSLAEYLPQICNSKIVNGLKSLDSITFNHLSNLKVGKTALDSITKLATAAKQLKGIRSVLAEFSEINTLPDVQAQIDVIGSRKKIVQSLFEGAMKNEKVIGSSEKLTPAIQAIEKRYADLMKTINETVSNARLKNEKISDSRIQRIMAEADALQRLIQALKDAASAEAKAASTGSADKTAENKHKESDAYKEAAAAAEAYYNARIKYAGDLNTHIKFEGDKEGFVALPASGDAEQKKYAGIADMLNELRNAFLNARNAMRGLGEDSQEYKDFLSLTAELENKLMLAINDRAAAQEKADKTDVFKAAKTAQNAYYAARRTFYGPGNPYIAMDKDNHFVSAFSYEPTGEKEIDDKNAERAAAYQAVADTLNSLRAEYEASKAALFDLVGETEQYNELLNAEATLNDRAAKAEETKNNTYKAGLERLKNSATAYYNKIESTASEDQKGSMRAFIEELNAEIERVGKGGAPTKTLKEWEAGVSRLQGEMRATGAETESFGQKIKRVFSQKFGYGVMAAAAMYVRRSFRELITTVTELNKALTDLQIVSNSSADTMQDFSQSAIGVSKEIGASAKDIIDAATVFSRLGFSLDESLDLSKYTTMYSKLAAVEIGDAENAITAIVKAFNVPTDQLEDILDKMTYVGNNFPISASQLGEGLNNAASSLATGGNSFEESLALLTAANTTVNICRAA